MMKRIVRISTAAVVLISSGVFLLYFFGPGSNESHRTNWRYLLWKKGWAGYDPEVALRFLNVDAQFRHSLRGKTKQEVQKWFPDLRSRDLANDTQQYYSQNLKGMDFLWIGESTWGIEFVDGKLKEFHLRKG